MAGTAPTGIPDGARLTPGGFHSFEHRWALAEAFRFHEAIGRRRVDARIRAAHPPAPGRALGDPRRAAANARVERNVRRARLLRGRQASIPQSSSQRLAARRIVASVTPYAVRYVRLGPGIVNTPAEIDAAIRAIAAL